MTAHDTKPISATDGVKAVKAFFLRLGHNCVQQDLDATEILFAPDVVSFGTKASVAQGLVALRKNQWERIWPNIEDFEILIDELRASAEGDLAWGMVPWTSTGFDESGEPYARPGRATAVLARRDGMWQCVHTHFSLAPGTPQRSFARTATAPKQT